MAMEIPVLDVDEMSGDVLTVEQEEALERQMMMSPQITKSPSPSELDEASMHLDKSILADEDIKDEECDLSMDGDEVLPALDEEQQVEQEKAITFMNSMRAKGVESVKLLLMGEVEKALELVTPHVNSHPLMANATAYIAYYEAMIAFDTEKIPTAKNKVSISQKMCKLMMQRSRKQLSHKKGVQRGSLPEPHLAAIVTYYEARIAIADCWLFTSVLTATKMAFTAYLKAGWQMKRAFAIYKKVYKELQAEKLAKLRFPGESGARERTKLLTSCSMGYGLLHMALSLIPPSQQLLMKIIGMVGDRRTGLLALRFCVEKGWADGLEARAPFALLGLVWYFIYLKPSITLSRLERQKSIVYARTTLRKYKNIGQPADETNSEKGYGDLEKIVLFTLMRARIARNGGKIDQAIDIIEGVIKEKGHNDWMKEILRELTNDVSWSKMAQLKYSSAGRRMMALHENVRPHQSKINFICPATLTEAVQITPESSDEEYEAVIMKLKQIKSTKIRKILSSDQLEVFNKSRAELILELIQKQAKPKTRNDRYQSDKELLGKVSQIFVFEATYMAGFLPRCVTKSALSSTILPALEEMENDQDLDGLSRFLQGAIYRYLSNYDLSEKYLREAIESKNCHKRLKCVHSFGHLELALVTVQREEAIDPEANEDHKLVDGPQVTEHLKQAKNLAKSGDFEAKVQFMAHNFTKRGDDLWSSSNPATNTLQIPNTVEAPLEAPTEPPKVVKTLEDPLVDS